MKRLTRKKKYVVVPLMLAAVAILGLITMLLWNALMPEILHLSQISFWQAVGLLILSHLLFGFHGLKHACNNHSKDSLHEKFKSKLHEKLEHMTPEEREEFRKHWYHHAHSREESKDHFDDKETTSTENS